MGRFRFGVGMLIPAGPLLAVLLAATGSLEAQEFDIRGVVIDSAGTPIRSAMVVALTHADSVIAAFDNTGGSGDYRLRRLVPGPYVLQVTAIGYSPFRRDITLGAGDLRADTVRMRRAAVDLEDLVVSAEHIPIVNRLDTLGYRADAFRTRPNATVEDLLKRLPGVEVDAEGGITAQGEAVNKVMVDGKEFFDGNPTTATRNLRADAVDEVQVFDKKSDAAEFTGIDDGQEEKAINLVLKEEARVGYFGQVLAGGGPGIDGAPALGSNPGTGARYTGSLSINRFAPSTQLAVVANANNIGQSGFSKDGGRGSGFSTARSGALNASREFGGSNWLRSSYAFSSRDTWSDRITSEQELQGSSVAALRNSSSGQVGDNTSHRLNVNAQLQPTRSQQFRLRGNLSRTASITGQSTAQQTRALDGTLRNTAVANRASDGTTLGGNANLTWRHRLSGTGRSLVAEAGVSVTSPGSTIDLASTTTVADLVAGGFDTTEVLQVTRQDGRTLTHSQRLGFLNPVGRGHVVEVFGQHRATSEDRLYNVDDLSGGAPVRNDLLSSEFERTYRYVEGGLRWSRNAPTSRWVVGLEVQRSDLNGEILDRGETVSSGYTHLLPSANLRRQVGGRGVASFNYRASTREPTLTELQPFVDNSDPLRVRIGNPDLEPEYTHNLRADYRFFDQFSFLSMYAWANLRRTGNDIVQSRTIDDVGRQETQPVNLGSTWSTSGGVSIGTPIRSLGVDLNLGYSVSRSTGHELINGIENGSRILNHAVNVKVQNRDKHRFDLSAGASLGLNTVSYTLSNRLDQGYRNSTLFGEATWFPSETWTVSGSGSYQIHDQELFGDVDNVAFVRASVSRLLLQGLGEVEFAVIDLLDRNQGVSVTSSANVIRDERVASMGRHFLLRFSYRLGRAPDGDRGRRGSGMVGVRD